MLINHHCQCKSTQSPSLVIYFFPIAPIKLKLGLQIGGKLLIATHLDQSNYLTNQQHALGLLWPFISLCMLCKSTKHHELGGVKRFHVGPLAPWIAKAMRFFDLRFINFNICCFQIKHTICSRSTHKRNQHPTPIDHM